DAGITTLDMTLARFTTRNTGQRVKRQTHQHAIRCRIQQCAELLLGRFERAVRHVVDQADVDALGVRFMKLDAWRLAKPVLVCRAVMTRLSVETDWHELPQTAGPESLIEVGDDVIDVFNPDAEPDRFRRHAGPALF